MKRPTVAIQGILFDQKSSFLKGPRLAPPKIREILHNGSSNYFSETGVDINSKEIIDRGDFKINSYFDIETITKANLQENEKILTLGGDHSISYPILKAINTIYSKPDILLIDAHADLYHEFNGDIYSHACPFARIMENELASSLFQVGIRTLNPHQKEQAQKFNITILDMKNFELTKIPEFKNPLYISLDMDAFDPAFAPGVSHPEPGGFSARQVIELIHSIKSPIIGADIVEYNPDRDLNDISATLAAKMMKEILAKMIVNI